MPGWREIRLFFRLSRPWFLLGAGLLYALGLAMARYLGQRINVPIALEGLALTFALQLMVHYLNEYYDADADAANPNRTLFNGGSGALAEGGLSRATPLQAAFVCLAFAALLMTAMLVRGDTPTVAWVILAILLPGAYFYSAPPVRLLATGYGEFVAALLVGGLVPTLAFTLQTGAMHRLAFLSTAPLVFFCFAMILAFEVPDYGTDLNFGKRTLMVRLGWETGMRLHDGAIVVGLVALLAGALLGLPSRVTVGLLIVFPLAAAQVWQMGRIRRGARPNWLLLTSGAVAVFGVATYLTFAGYATI